jgi:hypothetical protein
MSTPQHGHVTVKWCDQSCLVVLTGAFNKQGAEHMATLVKQTWNAAGRPSRWAHVIDMRRWEGGTPDSFGVAQKLVDWTVAHGVAVIVQLEQGNFLSRIVEGQGTLKNATVPVGVFSDPQKALQWLQSHGLTCKGCEALFGNKQHTTT